MNPRRRRLLIPGLLVVLILIVLVVSFMRGAEAADAPPTGERLGAIDDPRITESSGLAISEEDPDLAYTINDSGNADTVFAIELSTGDVVGVTTVVGADWQDTEALALHDGALWVADTGNNAGARDDTALWSLAEPGRGDGSTEAVRHRIAYPDGPRDIESLAIDPQSGRMLLVAKQVLAGEVLALPATLDPDGVSTAEQTDLSTLSLATDAAWTPDGRHVVVRNYGEAHVLDPDSGEVRGTVVLPEQPQGESLAVAPSGDSLVVGSEGESSQLWRVPLDLSPADGSSAEEASTAGTLGSPIGRHWLTPVLGMLAVGGLALVSWWMVRRPRRRRRRR
ncbi:hypothetical protein ACHAAC_12855 [Aeromicrobium sp. CF4.19]|uniref:hypothetical protein n=1 Tax=Aeromicrobium sp. CF4.19 TaxID=3373082 RepID=UPI003EE4F642